MKQKSVRASNKSFGHILQGASSGKLIDKWQGKLKDEVDEANAILMDRKQIKKIWREVDFNGNGYVSLAEIDKVGRISIFFRVHNPSCNRFLLRPQMVEEHAAGGGLFKNFDNKPALLVLSLIHI